MKERLQKILSARGVASRRKAEEMIQAGQVTVNGQTAVLGDTADPETDEFLISGNAGKYTIAFGQDEIIYERLEYLLNKRKGVYFDCSASGVNINPGILKSKDLLNDIKASAKRFWGKHSILSIACPLILIEIPY